jgi:hypothetical protein
VASGCSDEQQTQIAGEWHKIDKTGRFRVHFTPHMELNMHQPGGKYPYSNKPGGLLHWLTHAEIVESFVCLIDPDMLLLKPITVTLTEGLQLSSREGRAGGGSGKGTAGNNDEIRSSSINRNINQVEYSDASGVGQVLAVRNAQSEGLLQQPRVRKGRPAGQHFGIGGVWARANTPQAASKGKAWANFDKSAVCGAGSPCTTTSAKDADSLYSVGPVYLAHIEDWRNIAKQWWDMVPKVSKDR